LVHPVNRVDMLKMSHSIIISQKAMGGPGNVVSIVTAYGLDGPGIEFRWGEIFRTSPDRP